MAGLALPDMSVARRGCRVAVCIDGNVHVVGDTSDAATQLASMECFDPIASEWRTLPSDTRWLCAAVACTCQLAKAGFGQSGECARAATGAQSASVWASDVP